VSKLKFQKSGKGSFHSPFLSLSQSFFLQEIVEITLFLLLFRLFFSLFIIQSQSGLKSDKSQNSLTLMTRRAIHKMLLNKAVAKSGITVRPRKKGPRFPLFPTPEGGSIEGAIRMAPYYALKQITPKMENGPLLRLKARMGLTEGISAHNFAVKK